MSDRNSRSSVDKAIELVVPEELRLEWVFAVREKRLKKRDTAEGAAAGVGELGPAVESCPCVEVAVLEEDGADEREDGKDADEASAGAGVSDERLDNDKDDCILSAVDCVSTLFRAGVKLEVEVLLGAGEELRSLD